MADRKPGFDANSDKPGLDFLDLGGVRTAKVVERRPALTVVADILALVPADRAVNRRLVTRRELRSAGDADEPNQDRSPPNIAAAAVLISSAGTSRMCCASAHL